MSFKKSFEKTAAIPGVGLIGKGLKAAGKGGLALAGGGAMGALNIAGTGLQAAGDFGSYSNKMRAAQSR